MSIRSLVDRQPNNNSFQPQLSVPNTLGNVTNQVDSMTDTPRVSCGLGNVVNLLDSKLCDLLKNCRRKHPLIDQVGVGLANLLGNTAHESVIQKYQNNRNNMIQSINLLDGAENNYHLVAKKGEQENKIADNEGSGYFIVQNGQVQYIPNVSEVQSNLGLQNILNVLDCLSNENCLKSPHTTNSPDVHSDPSTLNTESFFYKTNQKNSEKLVFANFINDRNSKKVLNKTKLPRHLVKKKKRLMKSEDTSSALNFKHILPKLSNTNTNITSSCVTRTDSSNLFNDVTAINQSTLPTISRKNKSSNAYFNQLPDNILYRATLSSTSRKKKSLNRKKKPKVVLTSAAESNMSNLKHNTIYTDPIIAEETLMENPFTQYQIQSQSFNSNFINCVGMDTETPIQQQLFIQAQEPSIFQFFACKVGAPEIIEDRKAIAYIKVYDNLPILEQQTVPSQKYVNDLFHVFQNKLILGQTDSSLDDARND